MLDTLVTTHESFYADYPTYQETETLSHPQHQHHQPPHSIPRGTVMPPVSLDATTHTPGTAWSFFIFFLLFLACSLRGEKLFINKSRTSFRSLVYEKNLSTVQMYLNRNLTRNYFENIIAVRQCWKGV